MTQQERYSKEIDRIFVDYKSYLNIEAKKSLYDSHKYAEYFFKQLLNIIFEWELKHTEEKYLTNTSGIDLFSSKNTGYSVQITAQNSAYDTKIIHTINDYNKNWKGKYRKLKILFIKENVDKYRTKYNTPDGLIEIISFKELIVEINKGNLNKTKKILDFLKQEFGKELKTNGVLKGFFNFSEKMKGNITDFISNNSLYENNLLFYPENDSIFINESAKHLLKENSKIYLDGPPCSGKTTLLFKLVDILEKKLIRCYYIDLELWNENFINDIPFFENIDVVLIIDNSQIENFEISKSIYNSCNELNIRCFFISRDNSNKELVNSLFDFDFDLKYSLSLYKKDEQREKIKGVVDYRIEHLRKKEPNKDWIVGNYDIIYKNSQLNLLQISIILVYWEQKYSTTKLDSVSIDKCYISFYEKHINSKMDSEITFKYSNIYQYNCPFKLENIFSKEIDKNIEQGIFIQTNDSNLFYKFPHTEYAKLVSKAISYKKNITASYKITKIEEYLSESKPNNVHLLIEGLINENEYEHIDSIFSNKETADYVYTHYISRKDKIIDLKLLLFGLYNIKNRLNNVVAKSFLLKLLDSFKEFEINSYEKDGEEVIKKVIDITNYYKIKNPPQNVFQPKTRFHSKTFFELSELISKSTHNKGQIYNIAISLNFSEWKSKFIIHNDSFSKKVEGLTSLYKSPITRKLAFDLYLLIDSKMAFLELQNAPIDIIGKTLNNLSKFSILDGNRRTKDIFLSLQDNGSFLNQTEYGLSKYTIGLSHLHKANHLFLSKLYPGDSEIIAIFNQASANDLAQRIPLLINCFPNKKEFFIHLLKDIILKESFYKLKTNNLQGYIALIRVIKKQKYPFSEKELNNLVANTIKSISKDKSLIELSDVIVMLKKDLPTNIKSELITAERISTELNNNIITIKDLEQILVNKLSPVISIKIYTDIKIESLINSCFNKKVSFEQFTKVFMQLSNRELNVNKEMNYSKKLIIQLFSTQEKALLVKIKSANIFDFITGYCRLHNIDWEITETYLLDLLIEKSRYNHNEATLSNSTQPFRKLINLKKGNVNYNKISKDFLVNSKGALIKSAKFIDIGKISDGLKEISIEYPDISEVFFRWVLKIGFFSFLKE